MSPPKPSESPEANFYHILTLKNPGKKLQEAQNHTEATRKKPRGKKHRSAEQRCSERERSAAQAGFRHTALTARERDDDDDPTRPDQTTGRLLSGSWERIESQKIFFFCSFQAPPHLFPWGYFKRIWLVELTKKYRRGPMGRPGGGPKINIWAQRRSQKFRRIEIYYILLYFIFYIFIFFLKGEKGFPGFRARVTHHMGSDLFLLLPVIACLALSWPLISLFTLFTKWAYLF